MACLRASLNVAPEWYIILTKQWYKTLKRGHGVSGKEGPEATALFSLRKSFVEGLLRKSLP